MNDQEQYYQIQALARNGKWLDVQHGRYSSKEQRQAIAQMGVCSANHAMQGQRFRLVKRTDEVVLEANGQ